MNMCFSDTIEQIRDGIQSVTIRPGWDSLSPGDVVTATENSIFPEFKPGEKIRKIRLIKIKDIRIIDPTNLKESDVVKSGRSEMSLKQFIGEICTKYNLSLWDKIKRIEFEYPYTGQENKDDHHL